MTAPFFSSFPKPEIAYFCAEFALSDDLPIYSGGLGVLAGDVVRQAADDAMPMVAIGLFYHQGYFEQGVDTEGRQQHNYQTIDPIKAGLSLLTDVNNRPVIVSIPYANELLFAQVWHISLGTVRIYLLDSNTELNSEDRRLITQHLYNPEPMIRIAQEMLLGIGGVKLLRQLQFSPKVYHLNEGHSAFANYELAWELMATQGYTFDQARQIARKQLVFTNHTIVAAGNDVFPRHLISSQLATYAEAQDLPLDEMLDAAQDSQSDNSFSMTILALNSSHIANTVSQLHYQAAKHVWPDYSFSSVTNGVHLPTWVEPSIVKASQGLSIQGLSELSDQDLWQLHQTNKSNMLRYISDQTGTELSSEVLTVVWARRFAAYKRPNLVLQDIECLKQLAQEKQLQILFAGKAHPKDSVGQAIFSEIHRLVRLHGLEESVVIVPNYRMGMAKVLESGADIWLNTPIRGQEASGTSGMKAGANGALHLSTSDGWMDEVDWKDIGWILPDSNTAEALFETLKQEIMPLYYNSTADQPVSEWFHRMRLTMSISWQQFSAARMLSEYRQKLYQPIIDTLP